MRIELLKANRRRTSGSSTRFRPRSTAKRGDGTERRAWSSILDIPCGPGAEKCGCQGTGARAPAGRRRRRRGHVNKAVSRSVSQREVLLRRSPLRSLLNLDQPLTFPCTWPGFTFTLPKGAIALEPADGLERMLRVGMLVIVCFEGAASTHEGAHAGGLIVLGGPGVLSLDGPDAEGVLPIQHVTEAVQVRWIGEPARDRRADRGRRAFPRRRRSRDRCVPRPGRNPLRRHVRSRHPSRVTSTRRPGVRPVSTRSDRPARGLSEGACAIRSPGGAGSCCAVSSGEEYLVRIMRLRRGIPPYRD